MAAGYGSDIANAWIADFLAYLANSPVQDAAGMIAAWQKRTGIALPVVLAVTPRDLGGQDAAGALITGNPMLVGARDAPTGVLRALASGSDGSLFTKAGITDVGGYISLLADRAGILAVAPPVSKLWSAQSGTQVGAGSPTVTQASPGAGLRNCVLAWWYSIACGANPLAPADVQLSTGAVTPPSHPIACPANDFRIVLMEGPLLGLAAGSVSITGPAAPALSRSQCGMVGYVATFP